MNGEQVHSDWSTKTSSRLNSGTTRELVAISLVSFEADTEVLARSQLDAMHQPDCLKGWAVLGHVNKTITTTFSRFRVNHRVDRSYGTKRRKKFVDRKLVRVFFQVGNVQTPSCQKNTWLLTLWLTVKNYLTIKSDSNLRRRYSNCVTFKPNHDKSNIPWAWW